MPIIKGTMGYTRFWVSEPIMPIESIIEKLNLFKFRPLHEKGEDNETNGWSTYLDEYDHERVITAKDCIFDEKIILSMRQDTIILPKGLLKTLVLKNLKAYEKDHQKPASRQIKKEIEIFEAKSLRARILPKTKILESILSPSGELRVFSRSQSLIDQFLDLFQQTFLLRPQRRDFVYEGIKQTSIEHISHAPIFMPPIRVDIQ
jgi:hypothetical protein